jgi:hypothetical protein
MACALMGLIEIILDSYNTDIISVVNNIYYMNYENRKGRRLVWVSRDYRVWSTASKPLTFAQQEPRPLSCGVDRARL